LKINDLNEGINSYLTISGKGSNDKNHQKRNSAYQLKGHNSATSIEMNSKLNKAMLITNNEYSNY